MVSGACVVSGFSGSVVGGFVPELHAATRTMSMAPTTTDLLNTCTPESVNNGIVPLLPPDTVLELAGVPVAEIEDLPGLHGV